MAEAQRVEIGFAGGQVLSARLADESLRAFRERLAGEKGWYDLQTEDGVLSVDIGKVTFLRVDSGDHRVGFVSGS
jgi:hypothetical protein